MALRHGAPASLFQMALRRGTPASTCSGQQLHLGAWPVFTAPRQPLRHGAPAIIFQMALRRGALASTCPGQQLPRPAPAPASTCSGQQLHLGAWPVFTAPRQQQTSFGGEKYSGLASNLAHLGRIC